jgi:hypothetical protein
VAAIAKALAARTITRREAARFRADLAAVPDDFFRKFDVASRFGTYSGGGETRNGRTLVPPAGVPAFLVCVSARAALSCQDLNGDDSAPVGAGVYMADPAANWRPAPPGRQNPSLPPGIRFTGAEYRLFIDLIQAATVSSSSSSTGPPQPQTSATPAPKR